VLTKNSEKVIRGLTQRKNRKKTGLFVAEGMKLVREFVSAGITAHIVYHTSELDAVFKNQKTVKISESVMKGISMLDSPSPVLALFQQPKSSLKDFETDSFILLLDRIQDPGNMGTLLRTALWYNVRSVATTEGTVDAFSPKVVQSSMGAHAYVNTVQLKELDWLNWAKKNGYNFVIADMSGESARDFSWPKKTILVLGNEGQGPSSLLKEMGHAITIPDLSGKMESLNVAASGATLLYQYAASIDV
jgi:TrmH family RNA methyltransferase